EPAPGAVGDVGNRRWAMNRPASYAMAAEVAHRPEPVRSDRGFDRGRKPPHLDARNHDGDRGIEGSLRRFEQWTVVPVITDVHRHRGVDDPAVDVDADVELGEVGVRVDRLVLGRGAVVRRYLVARRLDG